MSESQGHKVQLYIYDLSHGLAQQLSEVILGKKFDGIWHTSVVVLGREIYFGSGGIVYCKPGATNLGSPNEVYDLGTTDVTEELLDGYLDGLRESVFAIGTYDLLQHNCNTFSNELSQFLTGKTIPTYILQLPNEITQALVTSTLPQISNLLSDFVTSHRRTDPDFDDFEELNHDIDAARQRSAQLEQKRNKIKAKIEKLERKKKKKRNKNSVEFDLDHLENYSQSSNSCYKSRHRKMSDNVNGEAYQNGNGKSPADIAAEIEEQDKREREERRRQREPPIVFQNVVNLQEEFDKVIDLVDGNVTSEEMQFFEELHQYLLEDEGSWAIGDGFLSFVGKLLSDQKFPPELRLRLLNVLAMAALKEDIILVLHQDRREHVFMNYAHNFDRLPIDEQKALALFVCNLFESPSSSEWLLYISEWDVGNVSVSNMRVTTKIAANSLLSENADLQNYGTAIIHNLACKEVKSVVFDDVAVELTMAVLQFFNSKPEEERLFRCMKALAKFVQVSQQDVSQLIQMIGPQPSSFRGTSERVDSLIASIESKLR